jgi:diguanylate cyclase (GGDEF)-like protein/PAS domain S-box-containing protein
MKRLDILMERLMPGTSKVIRTIRTGLLLIMLFSVGIGVLTFINIEQATRIRQETIRTQGIIHHVGEVLLELHTYLGSERAFLIAQQPIHSQRVNQAVEQYRLHMAQLRGLTADNRLHQVRLDHVDETFAVLHEELVLPLLALASDSSSSGSDASIAEEFQIASVTSRIYIDEMTKLLQSIETDEQKAMEGLASSTLQNLDFGRNAILLGTFVIILVILSIQRIAVNRIKSADLLQQQSEEEVRLSRDRLNDLIDATRVGVWEWDLATDGMVINERWAAMLGYSLDELRPVKLDTWSKLVHPDDLERVEVLLDRVIAKELDFYDTEYRIRHKDGHWMWIHDRGKILKWNDEGAALVMGGTHDDISQLKEIGQRLHLEKRRLETTLFSVGDGVVTTDEYGKVVMLNTVAEEMTGWSMHEAVGQDFWRVFTTKDSFTGEKGDDPILRVLKSRRKVELDDDTILVSRDGTERYVEDSASPIMDDSDHLAGVILVFRDVTRKRREREQILKIGMTDQLTGVYNRRAYEKKLYSFEQSQAFPLSFLIADVNGLKLANDAFGHETGDRLLVTIARMLTESMGPHAVVVRYGGDEFVVLMPRTAEPEAKQYLQKVKERFSQEMIGPLPISVSFGLAVKEQRDVDSNVVFRQAESNMYRRKIVESPQTKLRLVDILLEWQHGQFAYERAHSRNVERLAAGLGRHLGLKEDELQRIVQAARLHDIGKVAVNRALLTKAHQLDEYEWNDMRRHAEIGFNLLRTVPHMYEIAEMVLHHHERWDGRGYPRGVVGKDIPLGARMISICDTFDAITGNRPYTTSRSSDAALQEIIAGKGTQFDPELVDMFISMMETRFVEDA